MRKKALMILFLCLFSCDEAKELESKAPPEYKDVPIKLIYVRVKDRKKNPFIIDETRYCYEDQKKRYAYYKFPIKTVKVEVYDENDRVLDVSPVIRSSHQEYDYPSFMLIIIPYQKGMKSFTIFRLTEEGEKISNELYKKLDEEREREEDELYREKEMKKEKGTIDYKEWREKWEKLRKKWDKKVITKPRRHTLDSYYETLNYSNFCHYRLYFGRN